MTTVTTVLGDVAAGSLGHTQPHEHILADASAQVTALLRLPPDELQRRTGINAGDRWRMLEPLSAASRSWVQHHIFNRDNLRLTDQVAGLEDLVDYANAGGRTIVECTSEGLGRDPEGLATIASATGLNIVMGCGFYTSAFHPSAARSATPDTLTDHLLGEIRDGCQPGGIRPGIIGEIGTSWPLSPDEHTALLAAGAAQAASGLGVQVHPGHHQDAPFTAVDAILGAGADPSRVAVAHLDRTFTDLDDYLRLADTGVFLELDMFGQESSYYPYVPPGKLRIPNDWDRISVIRELIAHGYLTQILISQDFGYSVMHKKYGGHGYSHILANVIPLMRARGIDENDLHQITHTNPARLLCGPLVGEDGGGRA